MRSSTTSSLSVVALVAGVASGAGCSSGASGYHFPGFDAGTAGAAADDGGAGTAGAAGTPHDAATSEATVPGTAATAVAPSSGCGMAPGQAVGMPVMHTIQTTGMKDPACADSQCGAWSYARDYWLTLPTGYDYTQAYPLVLEGPACGGHGNNLYTVPFFDGAVIRVGLSPSADAQVFHSTNPNQGCFDNKEGDDSVDWVFYEKLYDLLASTLCFDKNRVFAAGHTSGGLLADELGCKYAGDATRPVRGVLVDSGGLPTDPRFASTCTNLPMAGFWSHEVNAATYPFADDVVAMNRALIVNGCTPAGVTYETATFDVFPISAIGGRAIDNTSCKRYRGCPDLTPLVVCALPGNGNSTHDNLVVPGWTTFLQLFVARPAPP